jgi:hypothetical protein
MGAKLRGLLSLPALRVFWWCGVAGVLLDGDHLYLPWARILHLPILVILLVLCCADSLRCRLPGVGLLSIGREAWVILLIEFTRRVRDALRLFLDEPITPNTQSDTVKVSENDN